MNRKGENGEVVINGLEAFKEFIKQNPDTLISLEIEDLVDVERTVLNGRK